MLTAFYFIFELYFLSNLIFFDFLKNAVAIFEFVYTDY